MNTLTQQHTDCFSCRWFQGLTCQRLSEDNPEPLHLTLEIVRILRDKCAGWERGKEER